MWWLEDSGSSLGSGSGTINSTVMLDPQDNFNLSCAARSIQDSVQQPHPSTLVTAMRVCQSILLFFDSFGGLSLNILVVILVAKYKKLHTLSFGIAVHIAAIDILFSAILVHALANSIANRWLLGEHMCGVLGASLFFIGTERAAVLFIFVVDRFLAVAFPFAYPKHQKRVVILLSLASWLVVGASSIIAYILDCYEFLPPAWVCFINSACSRRCIALYATVGAVIYAPSTIIPVSMYAVLFIKAKKAKMAMAYGSSESRTRSLDMKATITFFLMFVTTFALVLPTVMYAIVVQAVYGNDFPLAVYIIAIIVALLLSCLPIADAILILRNRDVKDVMGEVKDRLCKMKVFMALGKGNGLGHTTTNNNNNTEDLELEDSNYLEAFH